MKKAILGGMFAMAIMLGSAVSASATTAPTLKLTPNANLRNGEVVRVIGTGFAPREAVELKMCDNAGVCYNPFGAMANAHGAFNVPFKVLTGLGAGAGCGMSHATLKDCFVGVPALAGGYITVRATINFALNTVNGIDVQAGA
jgi:hypothetical protein